MFLSEREIRGLALTRLEETRSNYGISAIRHLRASTVRVVIKIAVEV